MAALLNFFLPGLGYVYVGIGREAGEMVFGVLVFIFYFVGFYVTFAAEILAIAPTTTSTAASSAASTGSASPFASLVLLVALLPFAFAYDGYRRAKLA